MAAALLLVPILLLGAEDGGPAFTIRGQVAATTGPVAGARVQLYDRLLPSVLLGEARSEEDGTFTVPVGMDDAQAREHPWAPVLVRVEAAGLARRATEFELGGPPVEIRLVPPLARRGRLVDGDGNPIPGAFLLASQFATGVEILVTSDENGAFQVDALGPEPIRLRIRAPGFEQVETAWNEEETIRLSPLAPQTGPESAVLQGRVLDGEGHPVAGARVTAGEVGVWTDARGEWRLDLPRAGMATLDVAARGMAPRRVTLRTDRAGRIDLRVVDGATIEGRVVDEEGAPVLGARVGAFTDPAGDPTPSPYHVEEALGTRVCVAWSGPDGSFTLRGVPPAATRLVAHTRGMGSAPCRFPADGPVGLVVAARLPTLLSVVDDTGRPLEGVELGWWGPDSIRAAGETDAQGRLSMELPTGRVQRICEIVDFRHGGKSRVLERVEPGSTRRIVVPRDHGDAAIRYAVEGDLPVEARLVHAEFARRLAGASGVFTDLATGRYELTVTAGGFLPETRTLVIERPEQELSVSIALRRAGEVTLRASPGARVVAQAVSGEPAPLATLELLDGAQVVQGFGPGTYRFVSRANGELIVVREVAIDPDGEPFEIDLRGGAGSTLAVEVRDRAGAPVGDAQLTLRTSGGFEFRTGKRTDAEGRASLDALIEGDVDVYAALGDRLGAERVTVTPGAALRVVVTLP